MSILTLADLPLHEALALPHTSSDTDLGAVERELIAHFLQEAIDRGVFVMDPARTWCGLNVQLDAGARVWPDVVLRGKTLVRAGAEIQSGCWIEDTVVGADTVFRPHCVAVGALTGARCRVGPMAHLRAGTALEDDVHVGNYVETKSTRLRRGAKANHLSYLGDADVGESANVGAGTITCNYDGFGKYRTTIGAHAFIGSNTSLVAPVTVGAGAIIGAGSVINRDIPADAIALERAELRILEGRAPALAERNRRRAKPA